MNENIMLAIMLLVIRQYKDKIPKGSVSGRTVQNLQQQLHSVETNTPSPDINNSNQYKIESGPGVSAGSVQSWSEFSPEPTPFPSEQYNIVTTQQPEFSSPFELPSSPPKSPLSQPQPPSQSNPPKLPPKKAPVKFQGTQSTGPKQSNFGPKSPPSTFHLVLYLYFWSKLIASV
jgi:hypothetical protein